MNGQSIQFSLGTDNSALQTGLKQAEKQVESFKDQTHEMLAGIFAGISIEGLLSKFSEIKKVAETFDTTTDAVQRTQGAAEHFDTTLEAVAKSMAKIRSGKGDVLEKLGIDAEKFKDAALDEQVLLVADALQKVADPQERVNKAFEALGPRAREIMPLLLAGSGKIKEVMDNTATLNEATVDQIAAADKELKHLQNNVEVGAAWILGLIDKIMQSVGAFNGTIEAGIVSIISRVGMLFSAVAHGDWSGIKAAFSTTVSDMVGIAKNGKEQLAAIWSSKPEGKTEHTHMPGEDDGDPAQKAALSLAQRLAAVQEEHDRKALSTAQELKKLAQEHAALIERQIKDELDGSTHKKEIDDALVENLKSRLSLEDRAAKEKKDAEKKVADERIKSEEEVFKLAKDHAHQLAELRKQKEHEAEEKMKDIFKEREAELGFASGNYKGPQDGQRFAGVNYAVVNGEAEKHTRLQEEMRNYLKSIDAKKWSVEIPDAS